MCADQGKPILVFIDVVNRNLPAIRVVAQFAFGSILATMEVSVAILALIRSAGEVEIGVTIATSENRMPAAKWKACLFVFELGLGPDRLPTFDGMTVLARNVEFSVRAPN
jgi:hypothetical protein